MNSWVVLGVGAFLAVLGLLFMRWHVREWRQERNDPALDPQDLHHYHARYRRRMQTSGMLVFLGLLLPTWDWLLDQRMVLSATLVGFLVFGIIGWIFLLAFGDMLSTRTHSHVALAKVRQKQRELERQVAELRNRKGNDDRYN
jgi:preprotein translocase subunit Sss1